MKMTPEQKLKWAIINKHAEWAKRPMPAVTAENVDEMYESLVWNDEHWDAMNEIRRSGIETDIPAPSSRNYESHSVAAVMPDGSWVGWTYWFGGGKHSNPDAIDWMDDAYDLECKEEEKVVTVRTFTKVEDDNTTGATTVGSGSF